MERVQFDIDNYFFFSYHLSIFLDICVDLLDFQIRPLIYFFFVISLFFFISSCCILSDLWNYIYIF
jgi:hypothetical protein